MREFRDAAGVPWAVFFTARSIARDHHLPEEYREGWLAFESAYGEKRRLAPVPEGWEALTDEELAAHCARATPQATRRKATQAQLDDRDHVEAAPQPEILQPQLRELETRLSAALADVCELPPPGKLNTGELIRVEETLAVATEAAKGAVSLRRKLRTDRERERRAGAEDGARMDDGRRL